MAENKLQFTAIKARTAVGKRMILFLLRRAVEQIDYRSGQGLVPDAAKMSADSDALVFLQHIMIIDFIGRSGISKPHCHLVNTIKGLRRFLLGGIRIAEESGKSEICRRYPEKVGTASTLIGSSGRFRTGWQLGIINSYSFIMRAAYGVA